MSLKPVCAHCGVKQQCRVNVGTCGVSRSSGQEALLDTYRREEVLGMSIAAAKVEATGYGSWDRATETIEFSRRMGYRRLGLAYCAFVVPEAEAYARRLEADGFSVASIMCKVGGVPKEAILGLDDCEKVRPGIPEAMCNPIAQARLLAEANVDLNVMMGLCVGHDAIFIQHAVGPVTCLVAKDRVHDHKPVEGIRSSVYFDGSQREGPHGQRF